MIFDEVILITQSSNRQSRNLFHSKLLAILFVRAFAPAIYPFPKMFGKIVKNIYSTVTDTAVLPATGVKFCSLFSVPKIPKCVLSPVFTGISTAATSRLTFKAQFLNPSPTKFSRSSASPFPQKNPTLKRAPTPVSLDVNVTANVASANVTFFTQPLPAKENNPTDDT